MEEGESVESLRNAIKSAMRRAEKWREEAKEMQRRADRKMADVWDAEMEIVNLTEELHNKLEQQRA